MAKNNMHNWNLTKEIKERVSIRGPYTNWKKKIGTIICIWALIPFNFSLWMMPIGITMMMGITPTLFLKIKLNEFQTWRRL